MTFVRLISPCLLALFLANCSTKDEAPASPTDAVQSSDTAEETTGSATDSAGPDTVDTSTGDVSKEDTLSDTGMAGDTPVDDTSADDTSVDDTPVDDTSADDTSVDDTSVDDTSVDDTSVDDTSVDDTSVDDTSDDVSVDDTLTDDAIAGDADDTGAIPSGDTVSDSGGDADDSAVDTVMADTQPEEDTSVPEDTMPAGDLEAPVWEQDAQIDVLLVGENHVTIAWSTASDESGVSAYLIYQDGTLVTKLAAVHQSLQISQLSPGTSYAYRVEAEDTVGNVSVDGPSVVVSTGDDTPPSWAPDSNVMVSQVTATSVKLAWQGASDNVGITAYRIYEDNLLIGTTDGQTTEFSPTNLPPWASAAFRVEAEDAAGNISTGGPTVSVQTGDDSPPVWSLNPVLLASGVTPTSVYLGWDSAIDDVAVTAYQVHQDLVEIAVLDGNTTWLKVENLSPGTSYTFEVNALDAAANSTAQPLTVTVTTPDQAPPVWPANSVLLASNVTPASVTLAWNAATDDVAVTGYRLYQNNIEIGSYAHDVLVANVGGLDLSATYIFRVEAEDAAANLSFGGPVLLLELSDSAPPQWPLDASVTVADIGPTWVTLDWSAASDDIGVAGYQVLESGTVVATLAANENSTTITALLPLTSYSFTLVATDAAGNSTSDGPGVDVTTLDYSSPVWPVDAAIVASNMTASSVMLTWSDPGPDVASFEVYQDDTLVMTVDAPGLSWTAPGLNPNTVYLFRVEAVGPTDLVSNNGPSVQVTTADLLPPVWPLGAALTPSNVTETSLTLTWSPMQVTFYEVDQDGNPLGTVDAPVNSMDVVGLSLGGVYTFRVEAVGPTGQISSNGPTTTVSTADVTAPAWDASAALAVDSVTDTSVSLSWTAASDNVAVSSYEVALNGNVQTTVAGNITAATLSGLSPATTYDVMVHASDTAGNSTPVGLSVQAITANAPVGITDQEVMSALQPTCQACHSPWFSSVGAFQSNVVANPTVLTPGDPDGSLIIQYMEENGPTSGQMPPVFFTMEGDSYLDMSNKGETLLTVQEIRDWIAAM